MTYGVCNSAVEQLLHHAASIAAIHLGGVLTNDDTTMHRDAEQEQQQQQQQQQQQPSLIQVPNVFIYTYSTPHKNNVNNNEPSAAASPPLRLPMDALYADSTSYTIIHPTINNTVPLSSVLDFPYFQKQLLDQFQIRVTLGPTLAEQAKSSTSTSTNNNPLCRSLPDLLRQLDRRHPQGSPLMVDILRTMRPAGLASDWTTFLIQEIPDERSAGVCWVDKIEDQDFHQACLDGHLILTTTTTTTTTTDPNQQSQQSSASSSSSSSTKAMCQEPMGKSQVLQDRAWVPGRTLYYIGNNGVVPKRYRTSSTKGTVLSHQSFWNSTLRTKPQQPNFAALGSSSQRQQQQSSSSWFGVDAALSGTGDAGGTTTTNFENAEFWNLVDFFVCRHFPFFMGHSVSLTTQTHLALRGGALPLKESPKRRSRLDMTKAGGAYWYNQGGIPLAQFAPQAFTIPLVYTYTSLSSPYNQYHLRASIASVRQILPHSLVYVLYHEDEAQQQRQGKNRKGSEFKQWLLEQKVKVIEHTDESWHEKIDSLRETPDDGDLVGRSHVHNSASDFFAAWQRVDLPLYMDTEYCLFLDSDVLLVNNPFATLHSHGHLWAQSMAFATGSNPEETIPVDAGVTLVNIPYLRDAYRDFRNYILHDFSPLRDEAAAGSWGPAAAYTQFVKHQKVIRREKISLLPNRFSFKPYWPLRNDHDENSEMDVIHFHGPKPMEYIANLMGKPCPRDANFLCSQGIDDATKGSNGVCLGLAYFALSLEDAYEGSKAGTGIKNYCKAVFNLDEGEQIFCRTILDRLVVHKPRRLFRLLRRHQVHTNSTSIAVDACTNFTSFVIEPALSEVPDSLWKNVFPMRKQEIAMRFGFWVDPALRPKDMNIRPELVLGGGIFIMVLLAAWYSKGRRHKLPGKSA